MQRASANYALLPLTVHLLYWLLDAVAATGGALDSTPTFQAGATTTPSSSKIVSFSPTLSDGLAQAVAHESAADTCNDDLACITMASHDRLGLEAIKSLHRQLDDDANGNIDLSESDDFLREELQYEAGYERRQRAFHHNDDMHISVRELWEAWLRSEVHNWTIEQTSEWLASNVELPQYVPTFIQHRVTGATLPRLAVNNMHYLNNVLGIKDPIHKQKIALKAMDVVLFGPPKDAGHSLKDLILVTLLFGALIGCWYAYQQKKNSQKDLQRMMKDMESLHKAELRLENLQKELERARMEQESATTEKQNLEKRLQDESLGLHTSYSDLEVSQLKAEIEMLKMELQRAEGELEDRCWSPPRGLQDWLQLTHEIENKAYTNKKIAAEKQLQQAREACEKLRKKRSSLVGAFVSTHGKSIDEVDKSIVEARTALNEVTNELKERVYRWKQIELLCGFNIINNNGLTYLENVLYRGTPLNGRGLGLRGRHSSQDDLDDESSSVYAPSSVSAVPAGIAENSAWRESSAQSSSAGRLGGNELSDSSSSEAEKESSGVVHFVVGDGPEEQPAATKIGGVKERSGITRSYSQDTNVLSEDKTFLPKTSYSENSLDVSDRSYRPASTTTTTTTMTTTTTTTMSPKLIFLLGSLCLFAATQVRAQDEEGGDGIDANAEELCQDRPGDEYFRLSVEGDCRDVVRCDKASEIGVTRLATVRCPTGLAFDIERQTCDWKTNVKNCDQLEKPRKVLPILKTDEPICPEGKLSCGNGECIEKDLFCNGTPDCKDESDENACTVETDPNRAPDCDPTQCVLPDCYCSADGTRIPGNIDPQQVPQMITITFNGAVNVDNIDLYEEIFNGQRQNPNGCQIRGTFFVSHKYTNYSAVQDLHRRGHEIAVFSLTHKEDPQYWSQGTYDDWLAEMAGARLIIERFANITDGSIIGMRAPYLRVGGNKQFEMMADQFFVYDASITASLGRVPIWPYTLYFRMPHKCNGNGGNCPSRSHPVWEMVMNELDRRDDPTFDESLPGCHMVDSCSNIQTGEQFARLLRHNFNRHFNSNRAPLGLHFHASWLKSKKEYKEELIKFIEEMIARSDVYFVTMVQVIKWMQQPTELSALRDFQDWKETCDEKGLPYCSLPNACPLTTRELPGETLRLFTCMECPNNYPWLLDPTGDGFSARK